MIHEKEASGENRRPMRTISIALANPAHRERPRTRESRRSLRQLRKSANRVSPAPPIHGCRQPRSCARGKEKRAVVPPPREYRSPFVVRRLGFVRRENRE